MQDHAPGHRGRKTLEALREKGIELLPWPPNSPDLNPIETLWCRMKDWLQKRYGDSTASISYKELRRRVLEAWDAIGEDTLEELVKTMPQRCQDVINAQGGHTKW